MAETTVAVTSQEPARAWRSRVRSTVDALVVVAALASVPLTIAQLQGADDVGVRAVDWAVWTVFVADAVLTFSGANSWRSGARRAWLAIALVVLTFPATPAAMHGLRLVRVTRLARVIRLALVTTRAITAIRRTLGRRGFMFVAVVNAIVIASGAGAIAAVEPEVVKGDYWNGLWWAIVTATTVGYGDISPASVPGRVVAGVLMFTGIGLLSTLGATITALFVGQEERSEFAEVNERLARIEALLEQRSEPGA